MTAALQPGAGARSWLQRSAARCAFYSFGPYLTFRLVRAPKTARLSHLNGDERCWDRRKVNVARICGRCFPRIFADLFRSTCRWSAQHFICVNQRAVFPADLRRFFSFYLRVECSAFHLRKSAGSISRGSPLIFFVLLVGGVLSISSA